MDPDFILNQILSKSETSRGEKESRSEPASKPDIKYIRERFLNALREITGLEKALEEKNTQLAIVAKEKERLVHALNKVFEDKKRLHDRLADFEILRNMEILEFKQGVEKMMAEKNHLLKESKELIEDIFTKEQAIYELRNTVEIKGIQLREAQNDLLTAIKTLRGIESKYKILEKNYKAIEHEKDSLKEKLAAIIDRKKLEGGSFFEREANRKEPIELSGQMASEISEYQATIEKLSSEINELNLKIVESEKEKDSFNNERTNFENVLQSKEDEIEDLKEQFNADIIKHISEKERLIYEKVALEESAREIREESDQTISELKERMDKEISDYRTAVERLTAERDKLTLKLLETNRELSLPVKEKSAPKLSPDKRMLFLESGKSVKYPDKMIYIAPARFGWIKKITGGIIIMAVLGIAVFFLLLTRP